MIKQNLDTSIKSEDHAKIMTKEERKRYRIQKMKIKFKNITNKISQIKKDNAQDISKLAEINNHRLIFEQYTYKSLEKTKQIISQTQFKITNGMSKTQIKITNDSENEQETNKNQKYIEFDPKNNSDNIMKESEIFQDIINFNAGKFQNIYQNIANDIDTKYSRQQQQYNKLRQTNVSVQQNKMGIVSTSLIRSSKTRIVKTKTSKIQYKENIMPLIFALVFSIIILTLMS